MLMTQTLDFDKFKWSEKVYTVLAMPVPYVYDMCIDFRNTFDYGRICWRLFQTRVGPTK